jgi:3-hydroxyacyl-[acyl-carrier-protein] dehydratase
MMAITLNINQIKRYLPHRYPFLFVDAVEDVVPNEWIRARKLVSANEEFFNGHFPGNPVMPGVIQIEAMAQAGALLAIISGAKVDEKHAIYVANIDGCRFRRPIVPGDVMELHSKVIKQKLGIWKLACEVRVAGQLASEATLTATSGPRAADPTVPEGLPQPAFSAE